MREERCPPAASPIEFLSSIQNPSVASTGALTFVDAFYDIRFSFDQKVGGFSISGYSGQLPVTIQNMPEEQIGAIYGAGDGSLHVVNYQKESDGGAQKGLNGLSSSVFLTRNGSYIFAASQLSTVLTVIDNTSGGTYALSLPGVYRVSVNPGGSAAVAFVQNSNYAYYARKLTASQTLAYSGGSSTWPKAAVDCEPQEWSRLVPFSRRRAPIIRTRRELPMAPPRLRPPGQSCIFGRRQYRISAELRRGMWRLNFLELNNPDPIDLTSLARGSGKFPTNNALHSDCSATPNATSCTLAIPGGSSNALVSTNTMYVAGQQLQPDGLFTGNLTGC